MAAALVIMLIGEYFLVPIQNTIFYALLLILIIGIFIAIYFSFIPQNTLTRKEKILSQTGSILFGISLFGLIGIIYNNLAISLIAGVSALIIIAIATLIGKQRVKDNALMDCD